MFPHYVNESVLIRTPCLCVLVYVSLCYASFAIPCIYSLLSLKASSYQKFMTRHNHFSEMLQQVEVPCWKLFAAGC